MVYAKPTILCSLKAVMQQLECYKKQSNNINFLLLLHHHLKCNEAVCKNARDLRLLFLHSTKIMLVEFFHMLQFNDILINKTYCGKICTKHFIHIWNLANIHSELLISNDIRTQQPGLNQTFNISCDIICNICYGMQFNLNFYCFKKELTL